MARDLDSPARRARARAGRIRDGIHGYLETLADIADAWQDEDWRHLSYDSWESYVDGEFGEERLRLPREYRQKAVQELRLAGMSTRAIAKAVNAGQSTVRDDLATSGEWKHSPEGPETSTGVDGKTYPAAKPKPTPEPPSVPAASPGQTGPQPRRDGESVPDGAGAGAAVEPSLAEGEGGGTHEDDDLDPAFAAMDRALDVLEGRDPDYEPERKWSPIVDAVKQNLADVEAKHEDRPRPAPWDPTEREAHQKAVQRRQDIEAARRYAERIVAQLETAVITIVAGVALGERGLVTEDLLARLRKAVDLLEKRGLREVVVSA